MDATMLMAGLTGTTVIGILVITLKDCWVNLRYLPKLAVVKLKD